MSNHVCPVWVGYLLLFPVRRWRQSPREWLGPFVREGMVVLEPGPAMGFFTLDTSAVENDLVFSLVGSSLYWYQRPGSGKLAGPWLGGTQDFGAQEPDSGWRWVTVETMAFLNWSKGQPDNQGNENALHFGESAGVRLPTWNDLSRVDDSIRGFVRELSADTTTVGLRNWDSTAWEGYTLFANNQGRAIDLIDNKGRVIHRWRVTDKTVGALYLLENGLVSQIGNLANPNFLNGGRVSLIDWDGNKTWSFDYSDSLRCLHHDAIWLPNGHLLAIGWERKTKDEAIAAGRDTAKLTGGKLWPEEIIVVDPATDSIVWEWNLWDHLVQDYDSTKANFGKGIVHRDIKPENLFLTTDGRLKTSTSASPSSCPSLRPTHGLRRPRARPSPGCSSARSPTCPPSRRRASPWTTAPTSSRSASCSTRWRAASGRSVVPPTSRCCRRS